jgi:hypothetical protein
MGTCRPLAVSLIMLAENEDGVEAQNDVPVAAI